MRVGEPTRVMVAFSLNQNCSMFDARTLALQLGPRSALWHSGLAMVRDQQLETLMVAAVAHLELTKDLGCQG